MAEKDEDQTKTVDPVYDENTPPRGDEEFFNVVPEDSEELAPAKDQSAVLDESPVEDTEDDEEDLPDAPATEGA